MTDYRDGQWHEWHGGECPVHKKDKIAVEYRGGVVQVFAADAVRWTHVDNYGDIIFFRVRTKHVESEPVVQWANDSVDGTRGVWFDSRERADRYATAENRIAVIRRTMIDGKVVSYDVEDV